MADLPRKPYRFDDHSSYRDYARKMDAFVYGPTTTYFDQLIADGIELPAPDAVSDADMRRKLWQVIAGLADRLVCLDYTDHLTDRELYTALWANHLRGETPVSNEVGMNAHIWIASTTDDDNGYLFFKHYADDQLRESWHDADPDFVMPPHEDPPFNRDYILPRAYAMPPEARAWLNANPSPSAFASNRFHDTASALAFVEQLYEAGATNVAIDNVMFLPGDDWLPYADTLLVTLPKDPAQRSTLFDLIEEIGQPDEDAGEVPHDEGQDVVRLWWD